MVGVDAHLVDGIGDAERIVQQNDGLATQRDFAIAPRHEVEVAIAVAATFDGHVYLPVEFVYVDTTLALEGIEQATCRGLGTANDRQQHQFRHDGVLAVLVLERDGVIHHRVQVSGKQIRI